ncbi:MAG: DNA primase [Patescibacteria group bacterium]|nr:DNA primase [Patescibacteria group bacterium]
MFSPIEEIKNRLDIVEVVKTYIKLEKTGINFRGLCPFHSEKKPSFFVSPSRQMWHCFGSCGEGGDIFKFVMKIEGVEFGDALRILAQRAGVELKKQDPRINTEKKRLYEICEKSAGFFEKQLESGKMGQQANKYLLNRGINKESIKRWRIGYSPDTWQSLSDFLISNGYTRDEIVKAGLAVCQENQQSRTYDRFRGRIVFPFFDLIGQVVGFTGRIFAQKQDTAKYVNTPNTLLYDKSKILYGLDKAKMAIRNKDACVITEGQTDVILSHQAGIENTVASSGTALTSYQLMILKRYSENLITAFDMDLAGNSATKRGIDLAQEQGFNIKVVVMPKDKDPADIISENLEQWKQLVENAKTILDFYFDISFSRYDANTAIGKKEISNALLPVIKKISNKIEQSHWIQKLCQKLEVDEQAVREEMGKIKFQDNYDASNINNTNIDKSAREPRASEQKIKTRKDILEQRIISLLLKNPEHICLIEQDLFLFFSPKIQEILENLKKDSKFYDKANDMPEIREFFNKLCFMAEKQAEEIDPKNEIQTCVLAIQDIEKRDKQKKKSLEIKKAEQENNLEQVEKLKKEFHILSQKNNDEKNKDKKTS